MRSRCEACGGRGYKSAPDDSGLIREDCADCAGYGRVCADCGRYACAGDCEPAREAGRTMPRDRGAPPEEAPVF